MLKCVNFCNASIRKIIDLELFRNHTQTDQFLQGFYLENYWFGTLESPGSDGSIPVKLLWRKSLIWTSGWPRLRLANFRKASVKKIIDLELRRARLRLVNFLKTSIKKLNDLPPVVWRQWQRACFGGATKSHEFHDIFRKTNICLTVFHNYMLTA